MSGTIGIAILIGGVVGLRFDLFILILTVVVALLGTVVIEIVQGDQIWSAVLAVATVTAALQIGFLAGVITREAVMKITWASRWAHNGMLKGLNIRKDMEVLGSDGRHVGTIDRLETAEPIMLSQDDM
jgi:hypothetical protein